MNNNEQQHSVMHRPETLTRIRQVQEWLISGTWHKKLSCKLQSSSCKLFDKLVACSLRLVAFYNMHILKEVAKLKGIYPSRNELEPFEVVKISLDSGDSKTGRAEKNHNA